MEHRLETQQAVDEQYIGKFDTDHITDALLDRLVAAILKIRPDIKDIADFGGGNGRTLDRVLLRIPGAVGTNYEISSRLRSVNTTVPNKVVAADSFMTLSAPSAFDLVLLNWVLHHMVGGDLRSTLRLIRKAVEVASMSLRPGGVLVVSENLLRGFLPERFASAALFQITKSRLLKPVVSRMRDGSAIAGVGIYYLSEASLLRMLAGLQHEATLACGEHAYGWRLKLIGISRVTASILILRKPG